MVKCVLYNNTHKHTHIQPCIQASYTHICKAKNSGFWVDMAKPQKEEKRGRVFCYYVAEGERANRPGRGGGGRDVQNGIAYNIY